ncbi:unnamed protein product [Rotaria sp. Silwood2]|nr:unnamed protein product [Rotaria sp. Silwood2]
MDAILSQPTTHFHAPQPDRVPAIQLKNDIKARAVITDESTSSIIHSALRTYPLSAAGELSRNEALMLMIRRQRTVETVDVNGRTFEVLSCQEEFCKVLNDAVKTLEDTGSPLEAASYYQKMSNKFDVGRDRSKYVLK